MNEAVCLEYTAKVNKTNWKPEDVEGLLVYAVKEAVRKYQAMDVKVINIQLTIED